MKEKENGSIYLESGTELIEKYWILTYKKKKKTPEGVVLQKREYQANLQKRKEPNKRAFNINLQKKKKDSESDIL